MCLALLFFAGMKTSLHQIQRHQEDFVLSSQVHLLILSCAPHGCAQLHQEDTNLPGARRHFFRPRLDTRLLRIIAQNQRTALRGVCWARQNSAPRGWVPREVQLYSHLSTRNLSCSWCCMARRVHLLGQGMARDHLSFHFIFKLLGVVLDHLILNLQPAHDGDSDLAEFNIMPG